jgi:hypothetical protein
VYKDLNSSDPMKAHIYKGYQVRYSPDASIITIVLSSANLSGVRYDVFNSNNNSVLNGLISIAGKAAVACAGVIKGGSYAGFCNVDVMVMDLLFYSDYCWSFTYRI